MGNGKDSFIVWTEMSISTALKMRGNKVTFPKDRAVSLRSYFTTWIFPNFSNGLRLKKTERSLSREIKLPMDTATKTPSIHVLQKEK